MSATVQQVVDDLGRQVMRSVAVDDTHMRLLAYSPHYGPIDDSRLESILHRVAPDAMARWVVSLGIGRATEPVRIPANQALATLPRLCIPIRHLGVRLGYLWLIDADESLTGEEIRTAAAAAYAAGAALHRERQAVLLERDRERELLRALLTADVDGQRQAATRLVDEELFVGGNAVLVMVVSRVELLDDEGTRLAFDSALTDSRRRLPSRHALHLTEPDHGVLLVSVGGLRTDAEGLRRLADQIRTDLIRSGSPGPSHSPVIGIGDRQDGLADAALSHRQAKVAARVAEALGTGHEVASWTELGVYRTLSGLPREMLSGDVLDPTVRRLLENDQDGSLLGTVERFLDHAGSSKRTADDLHVHRTTDYYRLGRVQDITGLDLGDGSDRLTLHVGIKLARLAGAVPTSGRLVEG